MYELVTLVTDMFEIFLMKIVEVVLWKKSFVTLVTSMYVFVRNTYITESLEIVSEEFGIVM